VCETWSFALRKEHLREFENEVLRKAFGPKVEDTMGDKKNAQ
jgi:hypothetical protein